MKQSEAIKLIYELRFQVQKAKSILLDEIGKDLSWSTISELDRLLLAQEHHWLFDDRYNILILFDRIIARYDSSGELDPTVFANLLHLVTKREPLIALTYPGELPTAEEAIHWRKWDSEE